MSKKNHLFLLSVLLALTARVQAVEFTVHASPIGEYMVRIGPTLEESTGLMMEIAAGAFRRAGLPVKVAPPVPWARAQIEAKDAPGAILVLLARTPEREGQWRWLSMIYTDKVYAYTLKGRHVYSSYGEIGARKARVAVKLGSASESFLKNSGAALDSAPDTDRNFMKLLSGRVDVLLTQRMEADPAIKAMLNGRYKDEFLPHIGELQRTTIADLPLWFVTSRQTPEADAQRLQEALERFKRTPEYRAIIRKYEASGLPRK
ncbi:ABC-type amino acid transport substrate-binding protein [Formivibrio citricus]|uniref:ABC-type amino acid transport substrate-binding protein n=1 Tax=Formivibrio citricus TaxID=83765 RepID=A0A1I4ZRC9_9NEIS|nr:transporter substrate-binding domain-containing protein [Formivibrio citricus]SFN52824.1 ABC-type amino acid transport substrate-binding protein [Formivibrio citricus]